MYLGQDNVKGRAILSGAMPMYLGHDNVKGRAILSGAMPMYLGQDNVKGRANPSLFPVSQVSFPATKQVAIYCWFDRERVFHLFDGQARV